MSCKQTSIGRHLDCIHLTTMNNTDVIFIFKSFVMCILDDLGQSSRRKTTVSCGNSVFNVFVQFLNCFPKQFSHLYLLLWSEWLFPLKTHMLKSNNQRDGFRKWSHRIMVALLTDVISLTPFNVRNPRDLVSPSHHVRTYIIHYSTIQNTALTKTMVLPNIENLSQKVLCLFTMVKQLI